MKKTIPYYNPNLKISHLFRALFVRKAIEKCKEFYKAYSGKEYVLLTNNCRSALFLAYSALCTDSVVLTSPLVCKVALSPITESRNKIGFADIDDKTWNIDVKKLPKILPESVKAVQLTHFGGVPGNVDNIIEYARDHNLCIIEDCAQGFGSMYQGKRLGTFGDVICFSGIKTAYGISGGVLATNDKQLYDKAQLLLEGENKEVLLFGVYRALRNCIDTYRSSCWLAQKIYLLIMRSRPSGKDNMHDMIKVQYMSVLSLKILAYQLRNSCKRHRLRNKVAQQFIRNMDDSVWRSNFCGDETVVPTKLYLSNPQISSSAFIERLNQQGIEAMHLQQKYASYYQDSLNDSLWQDALIITEDLRNFEKIHDTIVSVPLYENMTEKDSISLWTELQTLYEKEKHNMV